MSRASIRGSYSLLRVQLLDGSSQSIKDDFFTLLDVLTRLHLPNLHFRGGWGLALGLWVRRLSMLHGFLIRHEPRRSIRRVRVLCQANASGRERHQRRTCIGSRLPAPDVRAILARGKFCVPMKCVLETAHGTEAGRERHLFDSQGRVGQKFHAALDANESHVLEEGQAHGLLELPAKVLRAEASMPGYILQANCVPNMFLHVLFRLRHAGRIIGVRGNDPSLDALRERASQKFEQADAVTQSFFGHDRRLEPGPLQTRQFVVEVKLPERFTEAIERPLRWLTGEHLAAKQRGHVSVADDHRHGQMGEPGKAFRCDRRPFRQPAIVSG
jgi:hypothetical protein